MIGRTLSHYRIIGVLGRGGLGTIYAAEDTHANRSVAIKVLGPSDSSSRSAFRREAIMLSAVSHPHITHIYDYGETPEGAPFMVMELVKGRSVAELLRERSLSMTRSLDIARSVADALKELHSHGIIHSDLKPSNILIDRNEMVKVIDFGMPRVMTLPKHSSEESFIPQPKHQTKNFVFGTLRYMAPEQVIDMRADGRTDVFALGTTLYESLTGEQPFSGRDAGEVLRKVVEYDPPRPSLINTRVPSELDRIVLKALAKKPEYRYQSAAEMASDLDGIRIKVQNADSLIPSSTIVRVLSPYFSLEGPRAKGNLVEYGTEVDLVFNYATPPKDALVAFWGKRLEKILKEDLDLGITVIANGFTFRDGIWHRVAKFKNGELAEPVRFNLRSVDHDVTQAGFFITLSLFGCVLYQFPVGVRLVQSLDSEFPSGQGNWVLNLDLNEIITEREKALERSGGI